MSAASGNRQPWPMKWVLVAIILLIVPYTIVTLKYRRPGRAFEPYEDIKNRANVSRLLTAGFQRIHLTAQRPADGVHPAGGATVATIDGGLPPALATTLVEPPPLPTEVVSVRAAAVVAPQQPYMLELVCTLPTDTQQVGGAELYVQGGEAIILPTFEPLQEGLLTRSRQAAVLLTIPAGALKSGRYTLTVVGERTSRTWPLEVQ